jgi:pimeloyl-ACP methyl ester carboxylesterase
LKERTQGRDKAISRRAFRAHLKAIHRWGLQKPADLSTIPHPTLVANGESDRVVPSSNTIALAERLPKSELIPLYPDAGHGGIFQYPGR